MANYNATGRPEAKIDWKIVDQMLQAGSDGVEVAAYFGIAADTLYNRVESKFNCTFSAYSQEKKSVGKAFLRTAQYKKAVSGKGDSQMLKWLGIHLLGQKESKEEVKDTIMEILSALRDSQKLPGIEEAPRPLVEDQQSLPYQGCEGEEDCVSPELGAAGTSSGDAHVQHSPESPAVGDNNILLH